MLDTSYLNEWNEENVMNTIESGRPQWFKLWAEKYAVALDIEYLDEDLSPEQKEMVFYDVGAIFVNALSYFMGYDKGEWYEYKPATREGRTLWHALKRDIDQSYKDYEKRVRNGAKGGRPPKNSQTLVNTGNKTIG